MRNRIRLSGTMVLALLAAGCSTTQQNSSEDRKVSAVEMNSEKIQQYKQAPRIRHKREFGASH